MNWWMLLKAIWNVVFTFCAYALLVIAAVFLIIALAAWLGTGGLTAVVVAVVVLFELCCAIGKEYKKLEARS